MALVNCAQCGKEISDRATMCPNCGCSINNEVYENFKAKVCNECGEELKEDDTVCSNCGCPYGELPEKCAEQPQQVELTKINIPLFKNKKTIMGILSIILIVVLAITGVSIYKKISTKKYAEEYYSNLRLASTRMILDAALAEEAGNLIHDVWYNKIYDKYEEETSKYTSGASDFNEALQKLFEDESFVSAKNKIKDSQKTVGDLMKSLRNPPDEYQDAYEDLREFYDAYIEFTNLVINPTGNLNTYTSKFNSTDSELVNCYDAMQVYFSE